MSSEHEPANALIDLAQARSTGGFVGDLTQRAPVHEGLGAPSPSKLLHKGRGSPDMAALDQSVGTPMGGRMHSGHPEAREEAQKALDDRKRSHKNVEKRRRDNINDKFLELQDLVPALRNNNKGKKVAILTEAIQYIRQFQASNQGMMDMGERESLQKQLHQLREENQKLQNELYRGAVSRADGMGVPTGAPHPMSAAAHGEHPGPHDQMGYTPLYTYHTPMQHPVQMMGMPPQAGEKRRHDDDGMEHGVDMGVDVQAKRARRF